MTPPPTVVDFFNALLTPVIAILTVLIAVAQYRLAKATYRHDLYERRSAVYKATMTFIAQVTSGGDAKLDELQTFLRDTSEAACALDCSVLVRPAGTLLAVTRWRWLNAQSRLSWRSLSLRGLSRISQTRFSVSSSLRGFRMSA